MSENYERLNEIRNEANDLTIFEQVKDYAFDYMNEVCNRNVKPTEQALENLKIFEEALPSDGVSAKEILKQLHEYGSPATPAQTGGRYFGFVNGGVIPAAVASKWLTDVWDQNTALNVISPITSTLEEVCEKWIVELLGLPTGTAAGFVTGSSTASLCAMAAARNFLLKRKGYDVVKNGLFGAPPIRVVVSKEAHTTIFKALSVLGLGTERVETVPSDGEGRIDASKIPKLDDNTLLILQAGNVNTGSFDNFSEIIKMAKEKKAWVHVDGAFGLWAAASDKFKKLTDSVALADSWATDAHKTLNVPYDSGIVLCRDKTALTNALQVDASYIIATGKRDGMHYTLDMSRRARVIELWAALKSLGKNGVKELVDELFDKACYFAKKLEQNGFKVLNDVVFNQVTVYIGDQKQTNEFLARLQNSGVCWCGGSKRNDVPFVRISVCSYRTTFADIDKSVEAFVKAVQS